MSMYNLIKYSNNYLETSGSLSKYYWDESVANGAGVAIDFTNKDDSTSFNCKEKITGQTNNNGRKDLK